MNNLTSLSGTEMILFIAEVREERFSLLGGLGARDKFLNICSRIESLLPFPVFT